MPNAPKTPLRNIRVPDDEWLTAKAALLAKGQNLTDALRHSLRSHIGPVRIERHVDNGKTYWVVLDDRAPFDQPEFETADAAVADAAQRYVQIQTSMEED